MGKRKTETAQPVERRRANETLRLLRRRIVSGHFAPGRQLPTRRQLIDEMKVSPVTLQRALDRLAQEGFVYSKGRGGTYVIDNPPNLSRIPFIFSQSPSNDLVEWSVLNRLLAAEAPSLAERRNRKIALYYGIDGHADNEDFQSLVRDVHSHRVAGLLFGTNPWLLRDTPLLDEPKVPRVAITSKLNIHPAVESVAPDWHSFFGRALDHFAARGRRRVAMILKPRMLEDYSDTIQRKMTELNLTSRPYWQQYLGPPMAVQNCLHLLFNQNQTERPDALLITNDGWAEYAVAGLVAAGVRVPEDVEVVAHSNFPAPSARVLPFRRLGWEIRQFLNSALDHLEMQRTTGKLGPGILLPSVFEDEVNPVSPLHPAGVQTVHAGVDA